MNVTAAASEELGPEMLRPVIIENVYPELNGGKHPVKREVGDQLEVWADIFAEGHGALGAVLKHRREDEASWHETPMAFTDNDRWFATFPLKDNARYRYTIEAYTDPFESWRHDLQKKLDVGEEVQADLLDGWRMVREAEARAGQAERAALTAALAGVTEASPAEEATRRLLDEKVGRIVSGLADRRTATQYERELEVVVDREQARFAAWYEMFPRSQGRDASRGSTFRDCEARLPDIRSMGFDVLYLPPIHPIGHTGRKGRNNSLEVLAEDPGSPWAIGNELGGHKSVHPDLGTIDDFDHLVHSAQALAMEVALDFAIQCSPDHPYVREHPEWFYHRPDGSIRYAENPPKKYQDIFPIDFYCEDWRALWNELKSIPLFWIDHGVRIFRVDNPHTKPFRFWEWLIGEVQRKHPDVIFLAEAFTRPKVMRYLAKVGFTQSYTYFTWRNSKEELTEYLTELTQWEDKEYLRGNLFTNTPDILPELLQTGGPPAFKLRLALAATLSSIYGIYSGFELCEGSGYPGTEDYIDSEKYQYKVWDWDRPGNIKPFITTINRVRAEHPALQRYKNLRFYRADHDQVLFYGKILADDAVFVAVNLDPFAAHEAVLHLPIADIGIAPADQFQLNDLLTGRSAQHSGSEYTVHLDPNLNPVALFSVSRLAAAEEQDDRSPSELRETLHTTR